MEITSASQVEAVYVFVGATKVLDQPGMDKYLIQYSAQQLESKAPYIMQVLKNNIPCTTVTKVVKDASCVADFKDWLKSEFDIDLGNDQSLCKIGIFSGDAKDPNTGLLSFTWSVLFYLRGHPNK